MGDLKKPELSGSLCNVAADLIDSWCDEFCEPAFRLAWIMYDFAKTRGKPTDRPKLVGEFYRLWHSYRTRLDEGEASKLAIAALRASAKAEDKTSRMANVIDHAMQLVRNVWSASESSQSWRLDYLSNEDEQQLASRVTDDDFDDPVVYVRPGETANDISASLCEEARLARAVLDKWRIDGYSPPEHEYGLVQLFGLKGEPVVAERPQKPLTPGRYAVIAALIEAGSRGLGKDELVKRTNKTSAVNILKSVRPLSCEWEAAIVLAGKPGRKYRIAEKSTPK